MSEAPYAVYTGKIPEYFTKFQEAGIPDKVNRSWLETLGFRSGNDAYIIRVLKYIGFIDSSCVPTDYWKQYKDPTKAKLVLAQAIQEGYNELFATYSDAYRKDQEALYAFFSSKTGKSKRTVNLMVKTFTGLCQLADFEHEASEIPEVTPKEIPRSMTELKVKPVKGIVSEMHINIQLHLPATDDSTVYDNLFKSLKKHLLSDED